MRKLKSVAYRTVGVMSRSVMRTGAFILGSSAKLEALSAALEWFIKRNNYKPLQLSHESNYGDVHIMSDGKRIQLTWWLGDGPQPDDLQQTDNDACSFCNGCAATENKQQGRKTAHSGTTKPGTNGSDSGHETTAICKPNSSIAVNVGGDVAAQISAPLPNNSTNNSPDNSAGNSPGNSLGEMVGNTVGDAVGDFVGDVVEAVIDEVVEHMSKDKDHGKQTTTHPTKSQRVTVDRPALQ